jgi:hypothetical protein
MEKEGLRMACMLCESSFCDDDDVTDIGGVGVVLCRECKRRVEATDFIEGRWTVKTCPTCGHVVGLYYKEYKPRGRPIGSKNDPIKRAKSLGMVPLDSMTQKEQESEK